MMIFTCFSRTKGARDFAYKNETKMPESATLGANTGGVGGGTIGLLAGIGALAIPGLGPFIAASIFLLIGCGFRKLAGRGAESQAMAAKY